MTRLPLVARWLLRMSPIPADMRGEVHADLHELFVQRRTARGRLHAHRRLYHDVASLWSAPRQVERRRDRQSPAAFLAGVGGDLRYAVRLFARQPAILLLTIMGLSLGLGIATAAFSIMNVAVLRGEGLVDPDRVPSVIRITDRSTSTVWKYREFLHLREGATRMQVEAVLTDSAQVRTAAGQADPPSADIGFVTGGFFAATGGRVMAGRALGPADDDAPQHSAQPPVVISFGFWTSMLQSDPRAVGRTLRIGRTDATIVGVAERGFLLPNNRSLWMPVTAHGLVYTAAAGRPEPNMDIAVFGRLLPGIALPEAEAQLSAVAAALPAGTAPGDSALRVTLATNKGLGRTSTADTLAIATFVFAVIGLLLLLACANVATVLVSTAITREREMGVRAALGASRRRIVRQLVTESLALGVIAASIGLVFAYWAIPIIGTMIDAPAGIDLRPDVTVYLFLGLVTLITGVGAGLAPARHGRGADLLAPLKGDAGQNRVAPRRLRSLLVMTQAAVSVLLIAMATLFVRATAQTAAIDVGFDATGVYAVSTGPGYGAEDGGAAARRYWERARAEMQAVPGVAAVTMAELSPFSGATRTSINRQDPTRAIHVHLTGPEYFDALGIRTLAGRTYTNDEADSKAPVAVVSQSLARAYWRDQSPLGQLLPQSIPMASARPVVVGVVADTITARLHDRHEVAVYVPLGRDGAAFSELLIKIAPGTTGVIDQASQRLRAIDPLADVRVESVAVRLQREASRPRTLAILSGVIGVIAIVLCVIGLYGLTASVVGQRAREMAVRVAIGASPRELLRLLMWDSLRPVLFGLVVGTAAALLAGRVVVAAMFFGLSPNDPIALVGAAGTLLVAASLAVILPTRRAASVDAWLVLKRS